VRGSALQCVAVRCSALQCVAVRCSALQCVAVRCSALQCVAYATGTDISCSHSNTKITELRRQHGPRQNPGVHCLVLKRKHLIY